MAHAALVKQYMQFVEDMQFAATPEHLIDIADNLSDEHIRDFMYKYYALFAPIAVMYRKNAISQKSGVPVMDYKASTEDQEYLALYQQYMQYLLNEEAGKAITTITGTSQDKIKGIIRDILTESEIAGEGIDVIKRKIKTSVGANLRGNGWARSRAIAQTEMIKASNQASYHAVNSTGYEFRKYWASSGLEGVRPTHVDAEQDSINRGGLKKDELHSNGLRYVGDPNGSAEEVINCRCTELYEIV